MYNTKTFNDIYDNAADFITDYKAYETSLSNMNKVDDKYATITWTLLTGRYGNSPIANLSEEQFKIKMFNVMFMYAPAWAKRLDIQDKLRALTDTDLVKGSKIISNVASNPQTSPDTAALTDVTYIDQQTTQNQQKSLLGGYASLLELLETDVCAYYIDRFGDLFKHILVPDANYIYVTEDEE
jgi:hypothetical protein